MLLARQLVLFVALLAGAVQAQVAWNQVGAGAANMGMGICYDTQNQRFLMTDGAPPVLKTWNGTAWATVSTCPFQVQYTSPKIAFDSGRNRLVYAAANVNGHQNLCILEFDGTTWFLREPTNWGVPSTSWYGSVVYDPVRLKTIIIGLLTWEWDGTTLTSFGAPPTSPYYAAFNPVSGRVMLDHYELAGNTWTTLPAPHGTHGFSCVYYDPVFSVMEAFPNPSWTANLETWNGTVWTEYVTGTVSSNYLSDLSVAFDIPTQQVLGVGRYGTFLPVRNRALLASYGAGCPGALGVPALAPTPSSTTAPLAGRYFALRPSNIPPYPLALYYFMFGLSSTSWQGVPLPLDLTFVGMPGCFLNQSMESISASTGFMEPLLIPSQNALVGLTLNFQVMGLELFGIHGPQTSMSPGCAATIGISL